MILAPRNCLAQDVCIGSVAVAQREFGDVERHILFADFVERADNVAFFLAPHSRHGRARPGHPRLAFSR